MRKRISGKLTTSIMLLFAASTIYGQSAEPIDATVFQAAGPTASSIQSTIDQYRAAFGGVNNGNIPGPLAEGRREINWDGGGSTATSPGPTPFDVFLSRGTRYITPGSGFVQAPASGLADTFGNASYANIFQTFSPVRLFSPVGSNITDVLFFVPGGATVPAVTRGFGVVLSDVDLPDGSGPGNKRGNRHASSLIQYFAADGSLLFSSFAPASPGNGNLSFFGIVLDDPRIARVRITTGNTAPGPDDVANTDIVVMDDVIYGEPRPQP